MNKVKKTKLNNIKLNAYQLRAASLCNYFQEKGYKTFWVGGAVRDLLLAKKNFDIDLATEAHPHAIKGILQKLGLPFFDVGEKFGTIGTVQDGNKIEITTFRTEQDYSDFRHPDKLNFIQFEHLDVLRRDFTINALLFNPANNDLIDYVGGIEDLKNKIIHFVGEPEERISEDPLRMLRAVRFSTTLNFKINKKDFEAIRAHSKLIKKISGPRIKLELDKILASENYMQGIELLDQSGLLKEIFPEVDNLKKIEQSKDVHAEGNAFIHTLKVLQNSKSQALIFRYAALLHDIGKRGTAEPKIKNGRFRISFHGHALKGAEMFSKIAKRLQFSRAETKKIHYLIKNHMNLLHPEEMKLKTFIKLAKNEDFLDLIALRAADSSGSIMTDPAGKEIKKDLSQLRKLAAQAKDIHKIYEQDLISGNEVMRILNIESGKKVGNILQKIKEQQVLGKIKTKNDALNFVKSLDTRAKRQ